MPMLVSSHGSRRHMHLLIAAVLIEAALVCLVRHGGQRRRIDPAAPSRSTVYLFAVHRVLHANGTQLAVHYSSRHRVPDYGRAASCAFYGRPLPVSMGSLVQDAGGNPYESRPIDPQAATICATIPTTASPAKDFKAGYGPAWEIVLASGRFASDPPVGRRHRNRRLLWFKAPAALFDLGAIGALFWLLRLRGLSPAIGSSSTPGLLSRYGSSGGTDTTTPWSLFFVIAALAASDKNPALAWRRACLDLRSRRNGGLAYLLPAFARQTRSVRPYSARRRVLCGVRPLSVMLTDVTENAQFMSGFVGGWRNNDSLFGLLLYLTAAISIRPNTSRSRLIGLVAALARRSGLATGTDRALDDRDAAPAVGQLPSLVSDVDHSTPRVLSASVSSVVGCADSAGALSRKSRGRSPALWDGSTTRSLVRSMFPCSS